MLLLLLLVRVLPVATVYVCVALHLLLHLMLLPVGLWWSLWPGSSGWLHFVLLLCCLLLLPDNPVVQLLLLCSSGIVRQPLLLFIVNSVTVRWILLLMREGRPDERCSCSSSLQPTTLQREHKGRYVT